MPLSLRAVKEIKHFNLKLSYRADGEENKYKDTLNTFFNGKLETRHGYSRFNAIDVGGAILSVSYFKDVDGVRNFIVKSENALILVSEDSLHSSLNGFILDISKLDEASLTAAAYSLSSTSKHRGITLNNRHIMAIESDGLFQYNGNTFTVLGQDPPSAPTAAAAATGTITAADYKVNITFYDSVNGFETNATQSDTVTVNGSQRINVSAIPSEATNLNINKVRIYLEDVTNADDPLFVAEIDLGTTTYAITADPTSSLTPPVRNGNHLAGGAKYLTEFNTQLVYAGNSNFPNDVFFCEPDIPDALDDTGTTERLFISGDGDITGLATGFFNDSALDPYLVIFKKRSTHIYSKVGDLSKLVKISNDVGCVAHDTIIVKDGDVYFMSLGGWRVIRNGRFVQDKDNKEYRLGGGDIDDIFTAEGYQYQVNKSDMGNFFSAYYPTLDQYFTWTSVGINDVKDRIYVYESKSDTFRPYQFTLVATCAAMGEDSTGEEILVFGDENGYLYSHSIKESRSDVDANNTEVAYPAMALIAWFNGTDDYDATYSFRELIIRSISSDNPITVRIFVNYDLGDPTAYDYDFSDPLSGFVLDVSALDEGLFGDDRSIIKARNDINRTGLNIAISFYQEVIGGNLNLISGQLHYNKNGNPNID